MLETLKRAVAALEAKAGVTPDADLKGLSEAARRRVTPEAKRISQEEYDLRLAELRGEEAERERMESPEYAAELDWANENPEEYVRDAELALEEQYRYKPLPPPESPRTEIHDDPDFRAAPSPHSLPPPLPPAPRRRR